MSNEPSKGAATDPEIQKRVDELKAQVRKIQEAEQKAAEQKATEQEPAEPLCYNLGEIEELGLRALYYESQSIEKEINRALAAFLAQQEKAFYRDVQVRTQQTKLERILAELQTKMKQAMDKRGLEFAKYAYNPDTRRIEPRGLEVSHAEPTG